MAFEDGVALLIRGLGYARPDGWQCLSVATKAGQIFATGSYEKG